LLRLHVLESKLISVVNVTRGDVCGSAKSVLARLSFNILRRRNSPMSVKLLAKKFSIDGIAVRYASTFNSSIDRLR
jgi:hypothetical protein